MNKKYIILMIVTSILMVSACTQTLTTVEEEGPERISNMYDLYGIWQPIHPIETWREYRDDGTFRIAGTQDTLGEAPFLIGEYWFEEDVLYFKDVSGEPEWVCGEELVAQYEIHVPASGEIQFVKVKDGCSERAAMLSNAKYKRVEE